MLHLKMTGEIPRVLVLSRRLTSTWLHDVLGFRPKVRQVVAEVWQLLDALADGWFDLVVVDLTACEIDALQLVAMVRTAGRSTPFVLLGHDLDDITRARLAAQRDVVTVSTDTPFSRRGSARDLVAGLVGARWLAAAHAGG